MNKFLLAAIALGLWANAATTFIRPAHAEDDFYLVGAVQNVAKQLSSIDSRLMGAIDVHCDNCK